MKWDRLAAILMAGTGTLLTQVWGGVDEILTLLLTAMTLDFISGILCAYELSKLSSEVGFRGIAKKVTILIVVALAVAVDSSVGANGAIRAMVILFYVSMEGISILENAIIVGIEVPSQLEDALIQLKDGNKKSRQEEDNK